MRIRVKFSKCGNVKYVGHLDTMRLFQRAIKVAQLPVAYSQGFSPHSLVYFALPLAVGMQSEGEYMEIVMKDAISALDVKEKLERVMVQGIKVLDVFEVEEKTPSLMSLVQGADYKLVLKVLEQPRLTAATLEDKLATSNELIVLKKGKKGIAPLDIKPLVLESRFSDREDLIDIDLKVFAGSSKNLNPDLFIKALVGESPYELEVVRKELYTEGKDGFMPLYTVGRVE
ncbi:MAG: TIGR03936 family radical SAM-associated protein [Candidatus Cellulosilyticum pullistercoris]|uniref:TIGR03936 family radical SAM-associated protein n=1 Tax=Candidatus Cellulosilyticum pullistercoris TaxID=2838521 RepID=A0A9E2KB11_9FIRM|nr:TIGR03936 family radical SAM-associated protein [Candidatus Cellulosilyticum pullistercoris]